MLVSLRNIMVLAIMLIINLSVEGQTYHYKRVLIVKDNVKTEVNDDVHFLTFNDKGCYESDGEGYAQTENNFIKYIKDDNNMHCYYGRGYWGKGFYYFSNNYSRLNLYVGDVVFVYQRIFANDNGAAKRVYSRPSSNGGTTILIPSNVATPNYGSPVQKRDDTCPDCMGTGLCHRCNGTGLMESDAIYTGGGKIISDCPICRGTKHCRRCHGTGKLRL